MADEEPKLKRAASIGMWPPPQPGTTDLEEPGMFCSNDGLVINWLGENYYRACGARVSGPAGGVTSSCTKRVDHPGTTHEDYDGRTRDALGFDFSHLSIEGAVYDALGIAAACWENTKAAGDFDSDKIAAVREGLLKRIKQEGDL